MSRHALALTLLCVLTFFVGLGRSAITDSDEAFYAEAAREMIESRNWVTPYYNYEPRFEKPILHYWLIAGAYITGGVNATTARLPSALAGLGLALLTYASARRWYDANTALLAGIISATSFGYIAVAHQSLPDLPLTFFVVLATWTLIISLSNQPVTRATLAQRVSKPRIWLVVSAAAMGAGFLTKGPIAIALPVLVVIPIVVWNWKSKNCTADQKAHPSKNLNLVDFLLAAVIFVIIVSPWYLAMTTSHGPEYLQRFFVGENLERFTTERFNEHRNFLFYLPIVFGGLLPWSPFMLLWVKPAWQIICRHRYFNLTQIQLVCWAAAPLLFYTVSIGKQPRYILSILPPLAILLARAITIRTSDHKNESPTLTTSRDWLLTSSTLIAGMILSSLGLLIYRARILFMPSNPEWGLYTAAIIIFSGLIVITVAWIQRWKLIPVSLLLAALTTQITVQYSMLSTGEAEPVEQIAKLINQESQHNEPIGRYRVFVRNLIFYTQKPHVDLITDAQVVDFLKSTQRILCVIAEEDLERIENLGIVARRLGTVSYLNTGGLKLSTLVWPNQSEFSKTIVLITNQ